MCEVRKYIALLNGAKSLSLPISFKVVEALIDIKLDGYNEPSSRDRFNLYAIERMRLKREAAKKKTENA